MFKPLNKVNVQKIYKKIINKIIGFVKFFFSFKDKISKINIYNEIKYAKFLW